MTGQDDEPVWLTDEETEAWLAYLISSQTFFAALDRQLQRDVGIPHAWFTILAVLAGQPTRSLRQTDLAALAYFSLSRLSHAVTKLEARGWVRREPDPTDRRSTIVVLTDVGAAAQAAAAPGHVDLVRQVLFSRLSRAQVRQVTQISRIVLQTLAELPDEPPAPTAFPRNRIGGNRPNGAG